MKRGEWWLDHRRLVLHEPSKTLLAADLHLGYLAIRRDANESVPVETLAEELADLESAWNELAPTALLIAGDLMERGTTGLLDAFSSWARDRKITLSGLVPGNHDTGLKACPIPILHEGHQLGRWHVSHDGESGPYPVVHGHRHPAVPIPGHGMAPCFVFMENRLVLPAYSVNAAGGSVARRSVVPWDGAEVIAVAGNRVETLGSIENLRDVLYSSKRTRRKP